MLKAPPVVKKRRISPGDKVCVKSRVSGSTFVEIDARSKLSPVILEGVVTFVHPSNIFVNIDNGRYVESYYPEEVTAGWIENRKLDNEATRILPYIPRDICG